MTITVRQLFDVAQKMRDYGKGDWPVEVMHVEQGIPSLQAVSLASEAQLGDGQFLCLQLDKTVRGPAWLVSPAALAAGVTVTIGTGNLRASLGQEIRIPSELLLLLGDPLMGPAITKFVNDVGIALGILRATEPKKGKPGDRTEFAGRNSGDNASGVECGPGVYPAGGRWLIAYDDAEVEDEHYTDERAARHRFDQAAGNWNCHLYARIATTAKDTAGCVSMERKRWESCDCQKVCGDRPVNGLICKKLPVLIEADGTNCPSRPGCGCLSQTGPGICRRADESVFAGRNSGDNASGVQNKKPTKS